MGGREGALANCSCMGHVLLVERTHLVYLFYGSSSMFSSGRVGGGESKSHVLRF